MITCEDFNGGIIDQGGCPSVGGFKTSDDGARKTGANNF
jgi:hypothetical protein